MKIEFSKGKNLRLRVWIGELPLVYYAVVRQSERVVPSVALQANFPRCAALEFFKSTCGPSSYGLLGATFTPQQSDRLVICVAESLDVGEIIDWSLASKYDRVQAGLPSQYVIGVFDGAMRSEAINQIGSGILRFECAAHGLVGSSVSVFRRLSSVLMSLTASGIEHLGEPEIVGIVQKLL